MSIRLRPRKLRLLKLQIRSARDKLRDKIDPLQQRQAERAAARVAALKQLTFSEAAKQFIEQNEAGWKKSVLSNMPSR